MSDGAELNRRAVFGNWAERPLRPAAGHAVWAYCDAWSYEPGEVVRIHLCTTAATVDLEIVRDGLEPTPVFRRHGLPGQWHDTPEDCSVVGCGWPVALELTVPADWRSGGYRLTTRVAQGQQGEAVHHHLFIVRPAPAAPKRGRLLFIASTSTWTAYNDWGGSNSYEGITGPGGNLFSPTLSTQRPLARGFVVLPPDAPRVALARPPAMAAPPRYPHMEWALTHGYSKKYASGGWASYDRHYVRWAESAGYAVDIISQTDLHYRPELLEGYACVTMIGHDEYWSGRMRDVIEAYVERGGRVARFAGNFCWQIRLEDEGRRQICYKYRARAEDPVYGTPDEYLATNSWEAPELRRPGAATFGLNSARGLYVGWGGCVPRGARGFPIYRPEHWAFAGTGLYYGDILGAESHIFGYEVDGLDYVIRGGLPEPAEPEAVPAGIEILALGLSTLAEEGEAVKEGEVFIGQEDVSFLARTLLYRDDPAAIDRVKRGSGMIVAFPRGLGEVFHAGSCEWVAGLLRRDEMVEKVTRNVLDRYLGP